MSDTRWRLTPLDDSGLVYLGLDITNGNRMALFILYEHYIESATRDDHVFRSAIKGLLVGNFEFGSEGDHVGIRIDGKLYESIVWDKDLDRSLVTLIDRLTHMRMTNATAVSLELQLEMPL